MGVSKQFNPQRTIVMPRASRIRRDPVREEKEAFWRSREWEQRFAIIGVIMFAVAIALITVGISDMTSGERKEPGEIKLTL
jgi:hypothetical protein